MKKTITTLVLSGIIVLSIHATVRTVSNDPKAPAQYTNINDAIAASSNGDTILVYGSTSTYGSVTIDREIVLIGAGYSNPYGANSTIDYLNLNAVGALSASHSKISGFYIGWTYFNGTNGNAPKIMEGILIERCGHYYIEFDDTDVTYRDDTIRNCLISGYEFDLNGITYENIQIHNNIFDNVRFGSSYTSRSHDSVYVSNSVFVNRSNNNVFFYANDMTVNNCIFFAAEPQGCSNCAFNHNITYLNTDDQLDGTGNPGSIGSGNLEGTDPVFVTYPPGGGAYSYTHDLNVTNPLAIDGGTDATDIGIHGGMLPYTPGANPTIPQMTGITFPGNASSVKVGGTLDVTFKATKQD